MTYGTRIHDEGLPARTPATRRLNPSARKLLLTVHVTASVGLLGCDAAVLVLAVAGARGAAPATVYPAAYLLGVVLLVPLALVAVGSGVVQGLLTPWGLVRHWWVALKLVLNVAGIVLGLLVLTPALATAADAATAVASGPLPSAERLGLVKDAAGASTVLILSVVLSVYKPFGRLRGRRR